MSGAHHCADRGSCDGCGTDSKFVQRLQRHDMSNPTCANDLPARLQLTDAVPWPQDRAFLLKIGPTLERDSAPTNVPPAKPFGPIDAIDCGVGPLLRFADCAANGGHCQHPPPIRGDAIANLPRAGLKN
jgi:hypothetical protein